MKYLIIAILLFPYLVFANDIEVDTNNNDNKNSSIGYINNSTSRGGRNVAGADSATIISRDPCAGGVALGGQSQFFGFSVGVSKAQKDCNIRAYADMVYNNPKVFKAALCQSDIMYQAYEDAGEPCVRVKKQSKEQYPSSAGRK